MPTIIDKQAALTQWLSRLGYLLVLLGLLFFTPATDILPVELLSILKSTLHPGLPGTYFRVVPVYGEPFGIEPELLVFGAGIVLCGITLIALVRWGRSSRKS